MIQVTAYDLLGTLQVQVTSSVAHDTGYEWTHLVTERLEVADDCEGVWDRLWLLGRLLVERAQERGGGS